MGKQNKNKTGKIATFVVEVMGDDSSVWHGNIKWLEGNQDCEYRSMLELIKVLETGINKK